MNTTTSRTELSSGVIPRIMQGEDVHQPVLQILAIKRLSSSDDNDRFRLLISDGKYHTSYALLNSQLNKIQNDGWLNVFAIVRLDKYTSSILGKNYTNKRVLIFNELTVLNSGVDVSNKIGEPIKYENSPIADFVPTSSASAPIRNQETEPTNYNNNNNTLDDSLNSGFTQPIASLSPYQNKWVIRARVTSKSSICTWCNARGEGKFFSMYLLDESGEIRATAFKEQCDKFFDLLEIDQVYYFSKCQLKVANKQYLHIKNDFELTFTVHTEIQLCDENNAAGIPKIKVDLVPISAVASLENNAFVDTIGICKEVGELTTFTSGITNKECKKRNLKLVDMSNASVDLTLWGDNAENFTGHRQSVILVKGSRFIDCNGYKSLSLSFNSVMKVNPDMPESHRLRVWFDNGGGDNITTMVSARTGATTKWLTLREVAIRNLGAGDKADYFQCKAMVYIVKQENVVYKACPRIECNKKVIDEGNGQYHCERCNAVYPNFKYRLLFNMNIRDFMSDRWVTCFNEAGEQMLGHSAQEVGAALENNTTAVEEMFSAINFTSHIFKLCCKNEMYGGIMRKKLTVQALVPFNCKEYNKYLLKSLQEITGLG